jgi:hypothetical protein
MHATQTKSQLPILVRSVSKHHSVQSRNLGCFSRSCGWLQSLVAFVWEPHRESLRLALQQEMQVTVGWEAKTVGGVACVQLSPDPWPAFCSSGSSGSLEQ